MLSIVTPTLNAAAFLPTCLAEVARLGFPHEHIVVDGGSLDDTVAIARDAGATVLRQERANGMYGAINDGLRASRGSYLTYVNADDAPVPGGYAALYERIDAPDAPTLVYGDCVYRNETPGQVASERLVRARTAGAYFLRRGLLPFAQPSALFRREAFEAAGGFDAETYRIAGDLEFFRRMALRPGFRAARVPGAAAVFLKHGASLGDQNTPLAEAERRRMGVGTRPGPVDRLLFRLASWA